MCRADLNQLVGYLGDNLDKPKLLSEWKHELNNIITKRDRLTEREIAFAFKVIRMKGLLDVEHDSRCYEFSNQKIFK